MKIDMDLDMITYTDTDMDLDMITYTDTDMDLDMITYTDTDMDFYINVDTKPSTNLAKIAFQRFRCLISDILNKFNLKSLFSPISERPMPCLV